MSLSPRRVVIAATGTGVGKTFVACRLARALRQRLGPAAVLAVKPIESGGHEDATALDDGATVRATPHPLFEFGDPVSPHLAARRAGREISIPAIQQWLDAAERSMTISDNVLQHTVTVIETAGALLSPIGDRARNVELVRALEPARVLLVTLDSLGVLHALDATLTALRLFAPEAAAHARVVLNAPAEPDASTGTNGDEIERLQIAERIFRLERGQDEVSALVDWIIS